MTKHCDSCQHFELVSREQWPVNPQPRCMRTRHFKAFPPEPAHGIGAAIDAEIDNFPEPHRAPGDKCGPTLRHHTPKEQ